LRPLLSFLAAYYTLPRSFQDVATWEEAPYLEKGGLSELIAHLFSRINTASGPYQMVAVLGDAVVFDCPDTDGKVAATYFDEMPQAYFNQRFADRPRVQWMLG